MYSASVEFEVVSYIKNDMVETCEDCLGGEGWGDKIYPRASLRWFVRLVFGANLCT